MVNETISDKNIIIKVPKGNSDQLKVLTPKSTEPAKRPFRFQYDYLDKKSLVLSPDGQWEYLVKKNGTTFIGNLNHFYGDNFKGAVLYASEVLMDVDAFITSIIKSRTNAENKAEEIKGILINKDEKLAALNKQKEKYELGLRLKHPFRKVYSAIKNVIKNSASAKADKAREDLQEEFRGYIQGFESHRLEELIDWEAKLNKRGKILTAAEENIQETTKMAIAKIDFLNKIEPRLKEGDYINEIFYALRVINDGWLKDPAIQDIVNNTPSRTLSLGQLFNETYRLRQEDQRQLNDTLEYIDSLKKETTAEKIFNAVKGFNDSWKSDDTVIQYIQNHPKARLDDLIKLTFNIYQDAQRSLAEQAEAMKSQEQNIQTKIEGATKVAKIEEQKRLNTEFSQERANLEEQMFADFYYQTNNSLGILSEDEFLEYINKIQEGTASKNARETIENLFSTQIKGYEQILKPKIQELGLNKPQEKTALYNLDKGMKAYQEIYTQLESKDSSTKKMNEITNKASEAFYDIISGTALLNEQLNETQKAQTDKINDGIYSAFVVLSAFIGQKGVDKVLNQNNNLKEFYDEFIDARQ